MLIKGSDRKSIMSYCSNKIYVPVRRRQGFLGESSFTIMIMEQKGIYNEHFRNIKFG
jgi:hypothetical protein